MRRRSLEAIAILVGVFVAGGVAGGAAVRLWLAPAPMSSARSDGRCGGRSPDELVALFSSRLELDAAQRAAIEPILRRGWAGSAAIYEGREPELAAVRGRTREALREHLRPAQEGAYRTLVGELDAARAERRRCRQEGIAAARLGAAP